MNKLLVSVIAIVLAGVKANAQCCVSQCEIQKPKIKYVTKTIEKKILVPVDKEVIKVVDRPVPVVVKVIETVYKKVQKKNRVSLLGGTGPTSVTVTSSEVRLDRGAIVGVSYQRMLNSNVSVGVQAQSNQTVLGSVGFDF